MRILRVFSCDLSFHHNTIWGLFLLHLHWLQASWKMVDATASEKEDVGMSSTGEQEPAKTLASDAESATQSEVETVTKTKPRLPQPLPKAKLQELLEQEAKEQSQHSGASCVGASVYVSPRAEAELFAPDSEETRTSQFDKLKTLMAELTAINQQLRDRDQTTGSECGVGVSPSADAALASKQAGWTGDQSDDEEELIPATPPQGQGDGLAAESQTQTSTPPCTPRAVTGEQALRLVALMLEQKEHMQELLRRSDDDAGRSLLDAVLNEDPQFAERSLETISNATTEQLMGFRDPNGMTLLHHAVRKCNVNMVFALMDKASALCRVLTYADKQPARWTPFMILCDMMRPRGTEGRMQPQISACLVAQMDESSLNAVSTAGSTCTHMAVARGHMCLVKKALYRLADVGGKRACQAHLSISNARELWHIWYNCIIFFIKKTCFVLFSIFILLLLLFMFRLGPWSLGCRPDWQPLDRALPAECLGSACTEGA